MGTITNKDFGCLSDGSAINIVLLYHSKGQEWLQIKKAYKVQAYHPTHLANKIDVAFNCVVHEWLVNILGGFGFPEQLFQIISTFNSGRSLFMYLDSKSEPSMGFQAGLPQPSPLTLILFMVYTVSISRASNNEMLKQMTSYVDDAVMLQGRITQLERTCTLRDRIDTRIHRAKFPSFTSHHEIGGSSTFSPFQVTPRLTTHWDYRKWGNVTAPGSTPKPRIVGRLPPTFRQTGIKHSLCNLTICWPPLSSNHTNRLITSCPTPPHPNDLHILLL